MPEPVAREVDLSAMLEHLRATAALFGRTQGLGIPRFLPLGAASHAFGTLRSGPIGQAVTDDLGRVHGVQGLWVAGTARFPSRNAANPMLSAVATAIGTARAMAAR